MVACFEGWECTPDLHKHKGNTKMEKTNQDKKHRSTKTDMYGFPCLLRQDNNKADKEKKKDSTFTYSVNVIYGPQTANPINAWNY